MRGAYKKRGFNNDAWTLTMQKCGVSISLQQLKTKVAKLTHTKVTPFRDGILGNS
jgi:hypothetical protein